MSGILVVMSGLAPRIGYVSLQAGLMAVGIGLVLAAAGDRVPPRWRCALWTLVVARLLLPWAPASAVSVYNLLPLDRPDAPTATAAVAGAPAPTTLSKPLVTGERMDRTAGGSANGSGESAPNSAMAVPPGFVGETATPSPKEAVDKGGEPGIAAAENAPSRAGRLQKSEYADFMNSSVPFSAGLVAGWVWLLGALGVAGFAVAQGARPFLLISRQRFCTDHRTLEVLEECKDAMGFRPWLAVVETPLVGSPALFGFLRPRLLLPPGAIELLGPERLRHVFLHELAHLRRGDIAWNWLSTLALAIHWFNPLAWMAVSRLRAERELACDDLVLSRALSADPAAYGRTLLVLAESFSRARRMPGLAGIFENHPQLRRRIAMITGWTGTSARATALAAVLTGCVAVVTLTEARSPDHSSVGANTNANASAVDLVVKDLNLWPYPEGGLYEVVATVRNEGDAPVGKFNEQFLWSNGVNPDSPIGGGGYQSGPFEAGGDQKDVSRPFALREGTNRVRVVLDPDNKIAERNEENNTASLTITVKDGRIVDGGSPIGGRGPDASLADRPLPDFMIEDLSASPYALGGLYRTAVRIINYGERTAGGKIDVQFLWSEGENAASQPSNVGDPSGTSALPGQRDSSPSTPPGNGEARDNVGFEDRMSFISSPPFALADGTHTIRVVLNPDNAVAESNEENNTAALVVVVKDGQVVEKMRYMGGKEAPRLPAPSAKTTGTAPRSYEPLPNIDTATLDDVLSAYGRPWKYVWENQVRARDNLPASYVVMYREGFSVFMKDGRIMEFRYEQPGIYRYVDRITVGSSMEDVFGWVGKPEKTVIGERNRYQDGVFYRDIDRKPGEGYYQTLGRNVRFFFRESRVSAIHVTRNHFSRGLDELRDAVEGDIVNSWPVVKDCMVLSYLPEWKKGGLDDLGVANNNGGARTLVAWEPVPPEVAGREDLRFLLAFYSRVTHGSPFHRERLIEARPILADWSEGTDWIDRPESAATPVSYTGFVLGKGWKFFDVTEVVRSAAEEFGPPVHGVELRFEREDGIADSSNCPGYTFVSREGEGEWAEGRPRLLAVAASVKATARARPIATPSMRCFTSTSTIERVIEEYGEPIRRVEKFGVVTLDYGDGGRIQFENRKLVGASSIGSATQDKRYYTGELVDGTHLGNVRVGDVVLRYGQPESWVWEGKTFSGDFADLPSDVIARYFRGFSVWFHEGRAMELRYEHPGYRFRNAIEVGSSLDEVLAVFGRPRETVFGGPNQLKDGVLYRDIDGKKGCGYFSRADWNIRLFFLGDTVSAIYLTRSDLNAKTPAKKDPMSEAEKSVPSSQKQAEIKTAGTGEFELGLVSMEGASSSPLTFTSAAPSSGTQFVATCRKAVLKGLDLSTATLDDLTRVFGEPDRFEWEGRTYTRENLPSSYDIVYDRAKVTTFSIREGEMAGVRQTGSGSDGKAQDFEIKLVKDKRSSSFSFSSSSSVPERP